MKVINQKAKFEYELSEPIEVGVVLTGAEAKAARLGQVDLTGAHVKFQIPNSKFPKKELWVINMKMFPYKYADPKTFQATRTKKLLLKKFEMVSLESRMKAGRYTVVPTAMYTKGPLVKLEIALARGKKKYEKREGIMKRDQDREVERALKN